MSSSEKIFGIGDGSRQEEQSAPPTDASSKVSRRPTGAEHTAEDSTEWADSRS